MLDKIENILAVLDHADTPEKMDLPGFHLHPMTGDLRGFWSVTVRANWRIIWRYDGADAVDVELIDYHKEGTNHSYEEPTASGPDYPAGVH